MVVLAPAPPVTPTQQRALAAYIMRKRAYYAKKDAIIKCRYKWLEDLQQQDPDLEGIEITEKSLEELKDKRTAMGEEKHQLFEKFKKLLAQDDDDEQQVNPLQPQGIQQTPTASSHYENTIYPHQPADPSQPVLFQPSTSQTSYQPAYTGTPYLQHTPYSTSQPPYFTAQPTQSRFDLKTEPITPKKPSELSPTRSRSLLIRSNSPILLPMWEDVSPGHSPTFTPKPPAPAESKESRINSFTKAFSESLSKAMLSEQATKSESPVKNPDKDKNIEKKGESSIRASGEVKRSSEVKRTPAPEVKHIETKRPSSISSTEPRRVSVESKRAPSVTSETKRSSASEHSAHTPTSLVSPSPKITTQLVSPSYKTKSPNIKREVEKRREEREAERDKDYNDLPPVIKISKAEIHSKVMSWPTANSTGYSGRRQEQATVAGSKTPSTEQKKGKPAKDSDTSGSSLLEFAFQSALFGNTMFGENQTASPGAAAREPVTSSAPATPTVASDLLAALSLSYGGKKSVAEADSRKRARSPSPELVEVYQQKTKSPPPPPPPPPKPRKPTLTPPSQQHTSTAPPTSPLQTAICYPPFRSPSHTPTSPYPFLSPTLTSTQLASPHVTSPVIGSPLLVGYNSPSHRSPSIPPGLMNLPVPPLMQPPTMPPPGMPPPGMPPPGMPPPGMPPPGMPPPGMPPPGMPPPGMPPPGMPPPGMPAMPPPGLPAMPPPGLPGMPPPGCPGMLQHPVPGMLQHPGQIKNRNYNRYNF